MSRLLPNLRHCARSCAARIADRTPTHFPPLKTKSRISKTETISAIRLIRSISVANAVTHVWGKRLLRVGDVARSVEAAPGDLKRTFHKNRRWSGLVVRTAADASGPARKCQRCHRVAV